MMIARFFFNGDSGKKKWTDIITSKQLFYISAIYADLNVYVDFF